LPPEVWQRPHRGYPAHRHRRTVQPHGERPRPHRCHHLPVDEPAHRPFRLCRCELLVHSFGRREDVRDDTAVLGELLFISTRANLDGHDESPPQCAASVRVYACRCPSVRAAPPTAPGTRAFLRAARSARTRGGASARRSRSCLRSPPFRIAGRGSWPTSPCPSRTRATSRGGRVARGGGWRRQ